MGLVFSLLLLLTVGVFSSGGNTCKGKVGFLVLAHGGTGRGTVWSFRRWSL
ncbi:MAG: hypothetical protein Q9N26_02625 [Aquificota bacterium]|nr:hypothetical protein [Aquificota bacterium]